MNIFSYRKFYKEDKIRVRLHCVRVKYDTIRVRFQILFLCFFRIPIIPIRYRKIYESIHRGCDYVVPGYEGLATAHISNGYFMMYKMPYDLGEICKRSWTKINAYEGNDKVVSDKLKIK